MEFKNRTQTDADNKPAKFNQFMFYSLFAVQLSFMYLFFDNAFDYYQHPKNRSSVSQLKALAKEVSLKNKSPYSLPECSDYQNNNANECVELVNLINARIQSISSQTNDNLETLVLRIDSKNMADKENRYVFFKNYVDSLNVDIENKSKTDFRMIYSLFFGVFALMTKLMRDTYNKDD